MVSEPTLTIARTGQCAGIGRMACVGLRWEHNIAYGSALNVRSCAKREGS
jgi:hypothetical protein